MAQNDVEFKFGANLSELIGKLKEGQDAVARASGEMRASIDKIGGAFATVQKAFLAFTAVAMGGEALKKIIKGAGDWQLEALKLAKALGITTEQASTWQVALHHIGVESDVVLAASVKMVKNLDAHAGTYARLGVSIVDLAGKHKPLADIMQEVNAKLVQIHDPIEQAKAGLAIYGKSWTEVRPLMKLTAEAMEHAAARAKELGLVVGPEGAAMAKKYKESIADVELVGKSLTLQMGTALLPVMTQLGSSMADMAPTFSVVFGGAIKLIAGLVIDLSAGFQMLGTRIGGLAAAFVNATDFMHGGFGRARQILKETAADIEAIDARAEKAKAKLWAPVAASKAPPEMDAPSDDPNVSRASDWDMQLAEAKAAYQEQQREKGKDIAYSLEQERDYWLKIKGLKNLSSEESKAIRGKLAAVNLAIDRQNFAATIASLGEEAAAYKNNGDERLRIARETQARMAEHYGENSAQAREAGAKVVAIAREVEAKLLEIAAEAANAKRDLKLREIKEAEEDARLAVDIGALTSGELLKAEELFEQQRFAAKHDAAAKRLTIAEGDPDVDPKALAAIKAELLAIEADHEEKVNEGHRAAVRERMKYYKQFNDSITSSFQTVLTGFFKGTQTIGQTLRGLFAGVLDAISGILAKIAAQWLASHILRRVLAKAEGVSTITQKAAEAGASGVASMAGAPWPLNMSAPGFGAAMSLIAGSYGAGLAAEGGFDIPAGVNPVVQTHQREMILPAHIADPLRNMIDGGGSPGGGMTVHVNVSALDGASAGAWLRNGGAKQIAEAVRRHARV